MRIDPLRFARSGAFLATLLLALHGLPVAVASAQVDTVAPEGEAAAAPPEVPAAPTPPPPPERTRPWPAGEEGDRVSILGGNRTIEEGEVVRDVLVIGGNLGVRGEVAGDAVVVGGNLILYESGRILGDVVVAGGRFNNRGGEVRGELRTVDRVPGMAATVQREAREARRGPSALGRIGRAMAGIASTVALGLVLAGMGAGLIFYGRRYLVTVNDTIRASTLRSGGVGLAALFLVIPAFVMLIVALVVSIVGIPLLLVAIPLYPLAVLSAMAFGLLATAHALGERTHEQQPYNPRYKNSYAYLFTGLLILFTPVVASYMIGMVPFLGWVGSLLRFFAYVATWAALTVGLGAVLLSRAGTRRDFAEDGSPPLQDPLLDEELFAEEPRV